MRPVRIEAPAKINLRLRVLAREESGFHSLETLFCAVSLCDTLWIAPADSGVHLVVEGDVDTGPPQRNLVAQAAERFAREHPPFRGVRIRLRKRIPSAAGLGGGSSDAAACLRALNAMHGDPLAPAKLLELGAELGSDVPFFLCGSPLALGWGRGERLMALPALPVRTVLLAHPGEGIPTADAFRRIAQQRGTSARTVGWSAALADLQHWAGIPRIATNDFEEAAIERVPRLRDAIAAMRAAGAAVALLSGSGSAVFGVFPDERPADEAAARIGEIGFATWTAATLGGMPRPQVDPAVREG